MPKIKADARVVLGRESEHSIEGVDIEIRRPGSSRDLRRGLGVGVGLETGNGGDGKDKVTVCVRARPSSSSSQPSQFYNLSPSTGTLELSDSHPNVRKRGGKGNRESEYSFSFDALHLPPSLTSSLYENQISPLVTKAMQGFNSTIFAYGQTGSGKTHTMSGTEDEVGIIPLAIAGVFEDIENNPARHYLLRVSYLEIYNEQIRDLLSVKKSLTDAEKPTLHVDNGQVIVRPLVESIVRMPEEIMLVLKRGEKNRKTAGTDWNVRSSRSHAVFTITIESRDGADIRRSRLTLIDLAGSEKAASNIERLSEGKYINKSLLALGTVIEQLADKTRKAGAHIPYRNSKLTHLLENAIGGNANIAVICTLSLEDRHASETLETLKFANRCAQVETRAVKGVIPSSEKALLRAKEEEIQELKLQLDALNSQRKQENISRSPQQKHELADELEEMEARRDRLFAQLSQLNGEILSSNNIGSNYSTGESSAMRNRRRVSDFSRGQVGLGRDLVRTVLTPRRAVSGVASSVIAEEDSGRRGSIDENVIRIVREKNEADKAMVASLQEALIASQAETATLRGIQTELADLKRRFGDESAKRAEVQRLWEDQKEKTACLEEELAMANEMAGALRRGLDEARVIKTPEFVAAAEKTEFRMDERGLPLPHPEPLRHSGSLKEYRKIFGQNEPLPYTPSARAATRESEKVEQLETVIRGLKTVNQELLRKIAEWRQRVLQQDQLINSIADHSLREIEPVTPRKTGTDRTAYALTPSRSLNTAGTPHSGTSARKGHQRADSASYFGASPPPLPIAPGMTFNASLKSRRTTIEHDLGRLNSESKVDRVRAMFNGTDSPSASRSAPRT